MSDWTAGYVADIDYTFGYYRELNPLRVKIAFLNAGLVAPEVGVACELGFGQGLSVNVHAAASITKWYGTDFNPSQAGFAQELAKVSGTGAELDDADFATFAAREDLPEFDYIGLHGIWSWISDANRQVIVNFIARKLKVGGVLYISYNTLPGWTSFAPMRHLMMQHSEVIGSEGNGILNRVNGAVVFAEKFLATNPLYATANPQIISRIDSIKNQNRHYLAHEYFNRDWHPMHFSTMADWLTPAKLSYACSAHYTDHIDTLNLTDEQQTFLKDIPDITFRESVRDFMVNQQFRKDYWVKGGRKLSELDRKELMRATRVILVAYREDISLKITGALGEGNMSESVYNPILDVLADYKPKSVEQITLTLKERGISFEQIAQAILILAGTGSLCAVQEESVVAKAKKSTEKMNAYLIHKARGSADISYLVSPVTGGAHAVPRFSQLFLLALSQGKKIPSDWVQFTWEILAAQNQRILKDGQLIQDVNDNIAELSNQANVFNEKLLPILRALQIV
jgi:SAM-dependent methyltransferase